MGEDRREGTLKRDGGGHRGGWSGAKRQKGLRDEGRGFCIQSMWGRRLIRLRR